MNALIQVARNASPYLAVELLLPGGSVIALLLWLFRHRFQKEARPVDMPEVGRCSWIHKVGTPVLTTPSSIRRFLEGLAHTDSHLRASERHLVRWKGRVVAVAVLP